MKPEREQDLATRHVCQALFSIYQNYNLVARSRVNKFVKCSISRPFYNKFVPVLNGCILRENVHHRKFTRQYMRQMTAEK